MDTFEECWNEYLPSTFLVQTIFSRKGPRFARTSGRGVELGEEDGRYNARDIRHGDISGSGEEDECSGRQRVVGRARGTRAVRGPLRSGAAKTILHD
jgi:hypothetical protein